MQNRTLLAAIAAAAIAAVATPSISAAQDTTVKKTESRGEVAMQPSYSSLISAISMGSTNADKIKALTSVNASDVQFVNVQDLLAGNSPDSLNAVISKNEDNIEALRKALGSNQALGLLLGSDSAATATAATTTTDTTKTPTMPGMSHAKPSAKDVVAADVTSDNKVVLYYWKKQ
jgi:hypothetical protein